MRTTISQTFISPPTQLTVDIVQLSECDNDIKALLMGAPPIIGCDIALSPQGSLRAISFSADTKVLVITVDQGVQQNAIRSVKGRRALNRLFDGSHLIAGYRMERIALCIYHDLSIHVRGADIGDALGSRSATPAQMVSKILPQKASFTLSRALDKLWADMSITGDLNYRSSSLRAWVTCSLAMRNFPLIEGSTKVDTESISPLHLDCLASLQVQYELLELAKPITLTNEFSAYYEDNGNMIIQNARYKSRVRPGRSQYVRLKTKSGSVVDGRATHINGKDTTLRRYGPVRDQITNISVVGKEDHTPAENGRSQFVLSVLQGLHTLTDNIFTRLVWFPTDEDKRSLKLGSPIRLVNKATIDSLLNPSQQAVSASMLDSCSGIVITHGPPGTGKTRTIASVVKSWTASRQFSWLTAKSNVGVKNIAETLIKNGFLKFRLIVSKEFHFQWHEHIYSLVEGNLIRSDELPPERAATGRVFDDVFVVLCTVDMLSNPVLEHAGVFDLVPVQNLVVDEASQIYVGDYMPLFHKYSGTLRKVCWFGDPKQLPPFRQENVPMMQSIFETPHLKPAAKFLNTQYRMPEKIGDFISSHVYNGKLQSQHSKRDYTCLKFIDVDKGSEERQGTSWKNMAEVDTIATLVRRYYRHTKFCVITPYDPQRGEIEKVLKDQNLPWEGKVFNVDSFQGNEADYVLVSVVRSSKPGFLQMRNRVNVMLTRAKMGMVIVSSKAFLRGAGRSTLVGELAMDWELRARGVECWVTWRAVSDGKAVLPGIGATYNVLPPTSSSNYTTGTISLPISAPRTASEPTIKFVPGMTSTSSAKRTASQSSQPSARAYVPIIQTVTLDSMEWPLLYSGTVPSRVANVREQHVQPIIPTRMSPAPPVKPKDLAKLRSGLQGKNRGNDTVQFEKSISTRPDMSSPVPRPHTTISPISSRGIFPPSHFYPNNSATAPRIAVQSLPRRTSICSGAAHRTWSEVVTDAPSYALPDIKPAVTAYINEDDALRLALGTQGWNVKVTTASKKRLDKRSI